MTRETNTPLILWIAAICIAVRAHMMVAEGGDFLALVHGDHRALATMGSEARERVRQSEQTFEITGIDFGKGTEATPPPPPEPKLLAEKKKEEEKKLEEKKEEKKKEEQKKAEKKVDLLVKKDDKKSEPPPPMMADKRIAVRQHVKPDQADNPNAHFIGDQANHVDQETVATQTSHDQDDPNPTPGGNHAGADKRMGDSERTKIAESEEHAGDKNRAPGEKGTEFDVQPTPLRPMGPVAIQAPMSPEPPRSGGDGRPTSMPNAPNPSPALAPEPAQPAPEVAEGATGWSFNPTRPGTPAGITGLLAPGQTQNPNTPGARTSSPAVLGLGGRAGPGQVNLNLSPTGVVAIVGQDQIRKEREADGERRKSEHRGSWQASNFEKWRSAIENYVSSVKPGNQTALNTAAVPFAAYLNGMHNRIHPLFADSFLGSLDGLPPSHPLNDQHLITRLEIVLTRDGQLVKMGIVKTSGVTAFDIAALDSVQRASPYGPAPTAIVSPDGRVYLHWEFHRDEVYACSTMNARPFLLNTPPSGPPLDPNPGPSTPTPGPGPSRERGAPPVNVQDTREGILLARPRSPRT